MKCLVLNYLGADQYVSWLDVYEIEFCTDINPFYAIWGVSSTDERRSSRIHMQQIEKIVSEFPPASTQNQI